MTPGNWRRGLLVSVRDAAEAETAIAAGAAIIDVKEPRRGPLGRAAAPVAAAVSVSANARAAVTVACGELEEGPALIARHVHDLVTRLPAGIMPPRGAKAGPAGLTIAAWRAGFTRLLDLLPTGIEAVAVAYADWRAAAAPPPTEILAVAADLPITTLLVDTFDKTGPSLLALVEEAEVTGWLERARAGGLSLALAGRLAAADVPRAVAWGVDVVGVRSAACSGGRQGTLDGTRVRRLVTMAEIRGASPALTHRGSASAGLPGSQPCAPGDRGP